MKPETPDFTKDMYLSKSGEFKGISSLAIAHEDNRNSKSTRPKSSNVIKPEIPAIRIPYEQQHETTPPKHPSSEISAAVLRTV